MHACQAEKAERFVALHGRAGAFVIPNPWDAGTARILGVLGFEALTTTSTGLAFTLGRPDGAGVVTRNKRSPMPRRSSMRRIYPSRPISRMATATHRTWRQRRSVSPARWLGWSAGPSKTRRAIPSGRFTISSMPSSHGCCGRIGPRLPFPFVLVGRAENFLHGRLDLDDTIRRLQAYEAVGADVMYAPGLTNAEHIRTVCAAVTKPVNALMGLKGVSLSVAELAALGVRRISVGSALVARR